MTWTKLGHDFAERSDLLACSRSARLLHVEALVYANRVGSDGAIPAGALRRITDSDHEEAEAVELVEAGVWATTGAGWQIVDFERDQLSKAEVSRMRDAAKIRTRRQRLHLAGDHSDCNPKYCKAVTRDEHRDQQSDARRSSRTNERTSDRNGQDGRCVHGNKGGADAEGDPYCPKCADERRHTPQRLAIVGDDAQIEGDR